MHKQCTYPTSLLAYGTINLSGASSQCLLEGRQSPSGTHLLSEAPAQHPNPVLVVVSRCGSFRQRQGNAFCILSSHVPEELGRFLDPWPWSSLKQHILRGTQSH